MKNRQIFAFTEIYGRWVRQFAGSGKASAMKLFITP